jgi:hypothetical protein
MIEDYAGPATIEAHTTIYDRDGHPEFGTVLGRTPTGGRLMARVAKEDSGSLAVLTDQHRSPVGAAGRVTRGPDELLQFSC